MFRVPQILIVFFALVCVPMCAPIVAQEKITYDDHVKPIFVRRCATCHSPSKKSSDLDLTNFTNMMQGGSSGDSIEPGDASSSFLFQLITHEESPEMPPGGTKIPDQEIGLIEKWINGGALENMGSKAQIRKPKIAPTTGAIATRPDTITMPPRMPLESAGRTALPGAVRTMATSPWAPIVAISAPRQILLYQTESKKLLGVLPFPEGQVEVVRFSRSGQLLIAGGGRHGAGGKVVIWDVATGERISEVGDEIDNVLAADVSSDHRLIALGGPQKMLRVYSTTDGSLVYEIKKHTDWITSVAFSPDGVLLASGDRNGGLHVWEAETGNDYLTLGGHTKIVSDISWRSDANALTSASGDASVKIWEVENGRQLKSWTAHAGGTTSLEFTRDNRIASVGRDKLPKLWKQDGKLIRQFEKMDGLPLSVAFCNETDRLVGGDLAGTINVWSSKDGKSLGRLDFNLPSLAEKLATAKSDIASIELKLKPLVNEFAKVTEKRDSQKVAIDSTLQDQQSLAIEKASVEQQLVELRSSISAGASQRATWQTELEQKFTAKPAVTELLEKAVDTLAKLPGDEELKETTRSLEAKVVRISARIAELESSIKISEKDSKELKDKVEFMSQAIVGLQQNQQKLAEALASKRSELVPVEKEYEGLSAKILKLQNRLKVSQETVAFCDAELAFIGQLNRLKSELSDAEAVVDQRAVGLDEAKAQLAEVQRVVDGKVDAKKSAEEKVNQIAEEINQLRHRK